MALGMRLRHTQVLPVTFKMLQRKMESSTTHSIAPIAAEESKGRGHSPAPAQGSGFSFWDEAKLILGGAGLSTWTAQHLVLLSCIPQCGSEQRAAPLCELWDLLKLEPGYSRQQEGSQAVGSPSAPAAFQIRYQVVVKEAFPLSEIWIHFLDQKQAQQQAGSARQHTKCSRPSADLKDHLICSRALPGTIKYRRSHQQIALYPHTPHTQNEAPGRSCIPWTEAALPSTHRGHPTREHCEVRGKVVPMHAL